jgi:hypothetical protein
MRGGRDWATRLALSSLDVTVDGGTGEKHRGCPEMLKRTALGNVTESSCSCPFNRVKSVA